MMYQSKLVASLKANGKILREFKDTVYIPFGSEYSFLIKNLNTTRALVNIFIDGENVVEGGLVIDAGREVDLERYVKAGNLKAGNKFKFIERTQAVEDGPRGIKLEDGLIRIEFQYEKHPMQDWFTMNRGFNNHSTFGNNNIYSKSSEYAGVTDKFTVTASGSTYSSNGTVSQMNVNGSLRGVDFSANGQATASAASAAVDKYCADNGIKTKIGDAHDGMATMDWMEAPQNDVGITVPGGRSDQKFTTVTMGAMEAEKHTIVLKLLGETPDNKPVTKPVTVDRKQKCDTCGKVNKAHAKFCVECGTALEIFA
jgi:hypothetical protein